MTTPSGTLGHGPAIGQVRIWHPRVGSTMDIAADLARSGAPHGTVVQAGMQTAGRGRMGRSWTAAEGSALLTSWILRLDGAQGDVGALSPLMALAVIRAMRSLAPGAPIAFKWPNDVYIDDRKVAGILLTLMRGAEGSVIIAGIGVNLDAGAVPAGTVSTSLAEWQRGVTADLLLEALAREIGVVWKCFGQAGCIPDPGLDELQSMLLWVNASVSIQMPGGTVRGVLRGLTPDGSLAFQPDGSMDTQELRVGEIVRGPRAITG